MDEFYGKKIRKIEKKIFAIFFFKFFYGGKNFDSDFLLQGPPLASEASLAPQASHQPPKAASVRVLAKFSLVFQKIREMTITR